jgi:hypothetical protein
MSYNTILIKGESFRKEGVVASAQTPLPGHLLDRNSDGKIIVHGGDGGNVAPVLVAVENDLMGKEITDAYAAGDRIQYHVARPGDELYLLLANGENVTPADYLSSKGNGQVDKYVAQAVNESGSASVTITPRNIVARPLESINNTSGGAVRIRCEIV